ncbi:MAG: hypothetical protein ABSA77_05135, partial [Thermoguttaceae bacterium]
MSNKRFVCVFLAALAMLAGAQFAWAQTSAYWTGGSGNWSDATKWFVYSGTGTIANGATADAEFNTMADADGGQTITNDVNPTIGTMEFGNQMGSGTGWWNLNGGTITLDNGSSMPVVMAYVPLTINSVLAGTNGVNFYAGSGIVVTLTNTNTYTGGTTLSAPIVSISSLDNIGGAASTITFSGGTLQVTGTAITNLNTNTVNWASFDGGIDVADPTNTFTMNNAVAGGT